MCMYSIEKIDDLLEKPYYLIDFLPKRVPENANVHFLMLNTTCKVVLNIMNLKINV